MAESSWTDRGFGIAAKALLGLLCSLAFFVYWPRGGKPTNERLVESTLSEGLGNIQRQAAAELAARGRSSLPELRRVYQNSKDVEVRATCIQGMGRLYDYESMDQLLEAMSDPSALVRARASRAVVRMLGFDGHFDATGPETDRKRIIGFYRLQWEQLRGSQKLKEFEQTVQHRYGEGAKP